MPIYEYECTKCGERFELRRGISDSDKEITCPKCGKEFPRRLFSTFGTTSSSGVSCAPTAPSGST
jgi:putative FmdB family regulatory protein